MRGAAISICRSMEFSDDEYDEVMERLPWGVWRCCDETAPIYGCEHGRMFKAHLCSPLPVWPHCPQAPMLRGSEKRALAARTAKDRLRCRAQAPARCR